MGEREKAKKSFIENLKSIYLQNHASDVELGKVKLGGKQ